MIAYILHASKNLGMQDLFIATGDVPYGYADKAHVDLGGEPIPDGAIQAFCNDILSKRDNNKWLEMLAKQHTLVFVVSGSWGRARIKLAKLGDYTGLGSRLGLAVRFLLDEPPIYDSLGLPVGVLDWLRRRSGIILVVGITGDGKTTFTTALTRWFTEVYKQSAVSVEESIEYISTNRQWWQREVGYHTNGTREAVIDAMQQRPRLITISEVKTRDVADAMFDAAESGHITLGTVHADVPTQAPDRIAAMYGDSGGRHFANYMLASKLIGMVGIRLARVTDAYKKQSGRGMRAIVEIVPNTEAIANGIRTGSTRDLRGHVQSPADKDVGFLSFERHAASLGPDVIPSDEALSVVPDKKMYTEFMKLRAVS